MWSDFPLFPEQASSVASSVDNLFLFILGVSVFFSVLIATLLILFAVRFRRRAGDTAPAPIHGSLQLELLWSAIPAVLAMIIFVWGAVVFFHLNRPPDDTMNVNVVGKRWMWKLQHMNGRREINELHVPVGRAVRLNMTSEDVIHSFFVPAFRIKADAVPGRYTTVWFQATKSGKYHLFCTEYCGTEHSGMIGWIVVMDPEEYQDWLGGGSGEVSMASAGERLFTDLGCITCHNPKGTRADSRGPSLENVFGNRVRLTDGSTVLADEAYIRESILDPREKIVEGYQPVMPTFKGLVSEEGILQIIEYLRTRGVPEGAAPAAQDSGSQKPMAEPGS